MATSKRVSKVFTNFIQHDDKDDQYITFNSEDDTDKILQHLKFVEKIYPDQVIMLCNRSHPTLTYVGANCFNVFGIDQKDFQNLSPSQFFDNIHPEDLQGLQQCFEFINNSEPYDPTTHRFVLYYRFKRKGSDKYLHVQDEKLAIETDTRKYIYFSSFKDITLREKFFHVKLDIYRYGNGLPSKVYTYSPRQPEEHVTARQSDILKLVVQGFSNKEIADRLHVSIYTVKNHKQAMFRKVNVKNSLELINLASRGSS